MSDSTLNIAATPAADPLTGRRIVFALVVLASMVGLTWLLAFALSAGGFGVVDFILVALFVITLPWSVIGFWNATFGLFIMRKADPVGAVTPVSARVTNNEPIASSTAVLWCVRNEDAARVIRNIEPMMEGIAASGYGAQFRFFVLSDTNQPDHAADEGVVRLIANGRERTGGIEGFDRSFLVIAAPGASCVAWLLELRRAIAER